MKKQIAAVLSAVMVVGLLAGCGGGKTAAPETTKAAETTAAAESAKGEESTKAAETAAEAKRPIREILKAGF